MQAISSAFIFDVDLRFNREINFQITIQLNNYFLTEVEKKLYRKLKKTEWYFINFFFRVSSPKSSCGSTQRSVWKLSLKSEQLWNPQKLFCVFPVRNVKLWRVLFILLFICFIYERYLVFCRDGVWKGREDNRRTFSLGLLNLVGSGHLHLLEQKTCWMMQG